MLFLASVRGVLGTFLVLTCNFGVLLSFVLGYYFDYVTVAWLVSSLSILFVICFWFMPETPQHLVLRQRPEDAEKSLRYYRNIRSRHSKELNEELQLELHKLRATDNPEKSLDESDNTSGVTWADFSKLQATLGQVTYAILIASPYDLLFQLRVRHSRHASWGWVC